LRLVSSAHRSTSLTVALRRAYGAALYLEEQHPGLADRVGAVIDTVPADQQWTTREWMAFSIVVRRACRGLPFSDGDTHADHAIVTLRRQLARALVAAHMQLNASAEPEPQAD
jgi:hypothetical protein